LTDDGRTIAQAIRDGTAIAVSDGSFKDCVGTASWVVEGSSPSHRIRGDNIVPGDTENQVSYRSELSGLYGITLVIHALCEFYKIDQGTMEVGYDSITALERGFDETQNPSSAAQHFDLILTIRNIRARCPIHWKHRHVKGLLNIDMDLAAKVHSHRHTVPLVVEPFETVHIGDQFLNTGNEYAARAVSPCIWIINPHETTYILNSIVRLTGVPHALQKDEVDDEDKDETDLLKGGIGGKNFTVNVSEIERRAECANVFTGDVISSG
jgi:hypothetical protein